MEGTLADLPIRITGSKSLNGSNGTAAPGSSGVTTCVAEVPPMVWPSFGDFATRSVPIMPLAPARFSITTDWPSSSESFGAMRRITT